VIDDIQIKKLREFQSKDHCLQKQEQQKEETFKLTPPNYNLSKLRNSVLENNEKKDN